MSRGSRILLGAIFCFATALFLYTGIVEYDLKRQFAFLLLATFCLAVALAFLHQPSRFVTLRLIGVTLFCGYAFYAFGEYGTKNFVRAMLGFLVIGIPCGILAVKGEYPNWGHLAGGFNKPKNPPDKLQK
jgi:hypothetical protein